MLIVSSRDSWAPSAVKAIREKCREDLLFLVAEFLGWAGVKSGQYEKNLLKTPCVFHREAAKVVERRENALILAPRIHIKTGVITTGGTIQSLIRDPNWRNLLISETPTLVNKVLREIVWHFEENEKFRNAWPDYRVDGWDEGGTKNTFDVPCRSGPAKDYSIEAVGVGGAVAGGHFDAIRATDILSNKTVPPEVTEETMAKTWNFIRGMGSLLDKTKPTSHTIIEGTVWNGADAYCMLRQDPGYAHWTKLIYGPWDPAEGPVVVGEKPLWPEAYTREQLLKIKGELGEYLWSCNFLQDPMPADEDRMFLPSYFKHYELKGGNKPECPCCGGELAVRITGDLAISQAKTADWTALPVSGTCSRGSLVVLDCPRGRWTPYETVEKLYDLDALWKPSHIGIESVAWQKAMLYILHEEAKKPGRYALPVWEMQADNGPNGKLRRIGMLASYAASRGIWVRDGDHDALVNEALRMTRRGSIGGHDDMIDALGYAMTWVMRPAGRVVDAPIEVPLLMGAATMKGETALRWLEDRNKPRGIF